MSPNRSPWVYAIPVRLWILSDLHLESCRWDLLDPRPDYDVLIAAGDIFSPASVGVDWLSRRASGKPVIYVPGNHEWYSPNGLMNVEEEAARAERLAADSGVHWLNTRAVTIDGVRFLGATLWTDYAFYGAPARDMALAARFLNDHRMIFPRPASPPLSPRQAMDWHVSARDWLAGELLQTTGPEGSTKTVVITHHMPRPRSVGPKYAGDPLNPAFCSDLSALVERSGAAAWIHGHTHTSCDYVAGSTRVVCNPKGYGPRKEGGPIENLAFDPACVIEV